VIPRPTVWLSARLAIVLVGATLACEREERRFRNDSTTPPATSLVSQDTLQPGVPSPDRDVDNKSERNAYDLSEGKRLFESWNCSGCHSHGGGGMGPALMDDDWIYGARPEQIFASIAEGRPNGMPSFGTRVSSDQIWQLAAYVDSMSGHARTDAAPGRSDSMSSGEPELLRSPREYGKEESEE
jgi:cytochrome c oxidase cbb3-type subunit 3